MRKTLPGRMILAVPVLLGAGLCAPCSYVQQAAATHSPCVVEDLEVPVMPACVVQQRKSDLYIPKKYWMHPQFNRYGLAGFIIMDFGRVYVNRAGRVVIRDVANYDNGVDEFHHGLVRIERDGKYGFADEKGRIVLPAQYICAMNYVGVAGDFGPSVYVGGTVVSHGEHSWCEGGKWFRIDKRGKLTPDRNP